MQSLQRASPARTRSGSCTNPRPLGGCPLSSCLGPSMAEIISDGSGTVLNLCFRSLDICRGLRDGRLQIGGPPPPPCGPGTGSPERLFKALTDYTKPRQTIQSSRQTTQSIKKIKQRHKVLDKTPKSYTKNIKIFSKSNNKYQFNV